MTETKRILVYHDTTTLATRARKPRPGETVGYAAIADFDPERNATFDEVIDLSSPKQTSDLPDSKQSAKKGKGHVV